MEADSFEVKIDFTLDAPPTPPFSIFLAEITKLGHVSFSHGRSYVHTLIISE